MTLYELLHKVSFDEIAPFLSKSYTEGKPLLRHLFYSQYVVTKYVAQRPHPCRGDSVEPSFPYGYS